jgi:hypothetical protein
VTGGILAFLLSKYLVFDLLSNKAYTNLVQCSITHADAIPLWKNAKYAVNPDRAYF